MKEFSPNPATTPVIVGTGSGGILASADITALLATMSADLSTQMNAQIAIMDGWATGQP